MIKFIKNKQSAFTIVELLVVIVVIGILAAITIVSYSGIRNKAIIASLQSDLSNASTQFKIFHIDNDRYPATISTDCAVTPTSTTNLCLRPSGENSYTTITYKNPTPQSFVLTGINGSNTYHITENSTVIAGVWIDPNWLTIGTQTWARANLNVGVMVAGVSNQTDNSIVEKYCYNDLESNCTMYGGLYQWDEAAQYISTLGTQGICPTGSHLPTDDEWGVLEMYLGMSPAVVGGYYWRGTDQGTKLKVGGVSGLDIPLAGYRITNGLFGNLSVNAYLWSSPVSASYFGYRLASAAETSMYRADDVKEFGRSVRCLED